jgi:hypothetical protein
MILVRRKVLIPYGRVRMNRLNGFTAGQTVFEPVVGIEPTTWRLQGGTT